MGQLLLPKHFAPGFGNPRVAPDENLVEIDWKHPLAEGLLFYSIGLRDMVSGKIAQPVDGWGNVGRSHGPQGLALRSTTSSSNGFEWENCTEFSRVNGTKFLTVIASFSVESGSANARATGVPQARTGFAAPHTSFSTGVDGGGLKFRIYFTESGGSTVVTNTVSTVAFAADGKFVCLGVTKNDTTTMATYKNGLLFSNKVTALNSSAMQWSTQYSLFALGPDADKADMSVKGQLKYHAWWLRELSAGEHALFYANPHALLKPRVPTLYYTASAPPGPLDLNRISSMHFMRHYEPTAMGE